ncbi:MAG: EamA family transporter [Anaerolineae bacterium]|nr:EamA family transporter [Anaerolineae bacterium]
MAKIKISRSAAGYLFALGSAAVIATAFVVRKSISTQVNPAMFSVWWYGFAGLYAWFTPCCAVNGSRSTAKRMVLTAAGAFISPFLGYVLRYGALARIDAAKVAVVAAAQPVFVTLYTAILFAQWPTAQQSLGGILATAGVLLIFRARDAGGNR